MNKPAHYRGCSHLMRPITAHEEICARTIGELTVHKDKFDSIAFSGMSGALVAPTVALMLNKGIVCVRKNSDKHHGIEPIDGHITKQYVIVDDLVDTGTTIRFIQTKLWIELKATCIGMYMYLDQCYSTPLTRPDYFMTSSQLCEEAARYVAQDLL